MGFQKTEELESYGIRKNLKNIKIRQYHSNITKKLVSNFFGLFQVFWQGLQISFKTQILEIRKCYTTLILSKIRIYFKAPIHLRNASKIHLNVASKSLFKIEIQTI